MENRKRTAKARGTKAARATTGHTGSALLKALVLGAAAVSLASVYGCGGSPETYGRELSDRPVTSIEAILETPADYTGEGVRVEGKITAECTSGCWFTLEERGVGIHIDLKPSGLAIPQYVGREAAVEGVVRTEGRRVMIVGKGVEIL